MNVLFLTISNIKDFESRSLYIDLVKQFISQGHYVTVLSGCENRFRKIDDKDYYSCGDAGEIYKVFIPDITRVKSTIKKGIGLLSLIPAYRRITKKAMRHKTYDLVVYGSPPVTIYSAISAVKKKQGAFSYLLLKDIWPYDCLYDNTLSKKGLKGIAFYTLAMMARELYKASDCIGVMSPANVQFLHENEPSIPLKKIEVNPNSIQPFKAECDESKRNELREKYGIPKDKVVYIYGGNLGTPQGLEFAMESVKASSVVSDAFFVFVGSGTKRKWIEEYIARENLGNILLLDAMPKDEYETLVFACDVGLIYLNHKCLSPNYPSRLLPYMQARLPVICATDPYTDVGKIAQDNEYGIWCESDNTSAFVSCIKKLNQENIRTPMGLNAYEYLMNNYTVENSYNIIMSRMEMDKRELTEV